MPKFRERNPFNAKNWGEVKFVPKVPKQKESNKEPNAPTPWKKFKNDLIEKQREDDTSNTIDVNSPEAQKMFKEREQNYRRMLITDQSKQPKKWESFENNAASETPKIPHFLKGVDLQNFDSKQLNFKQNNIIRKTITKLTKDTKEDSLKATVRDMKRQKKLQSLRNAAKHKPKK